MPLGVTSDDIRNMSIDGLRELNDIAGKMVTLTIIESYKPEYAELEAMTKAEILRREVEAAVEMIQSAIRREENRAAENAKILKAKQALADRNINITDRRIKKVKFFRASIRPEQRKIEPDAASLERGR